MGKGRAGQVLLAGDLRAGHWRILRRVEIHTESTVFCLVYLPTYAPWLNPIEKLWRKAYQEVLHLHRYSDCWEELIQRMHDFLSRYTSGSNELLRYVGLLPN